MLKNKNRVKRNLLTINGVIEFKRTLLVPADKESAENLKKIQKSKSVCPLDCMLGIDNLPFKITIHMMSAIAKEGVRASSYRRATESIKEHYHIDISERTVRDVTDYVGVVLFEYCKHEADKAKDNHGTPIDRRKKHRRDDDILYLEMDGSMVETRPVSAKDDKWRECKIGIAFLSEDIKTWITKKGEERRAITKKRFTGFIGYYKDFQYYLLSIAEYYQYKYRSKIVIISDGAEWISKIRKELFPEAIHILDLSHVKEHVNRYAKWLFKTDETAINQWVAEINTMIENSQTQEVLSKLIEYKDLKHPADITNLYKYIYERQESMDYKAFKDAGFYVGSGAIESANKYVMQDRMKLQGMRWNVPNAQGMLTLKTYYESNCWNEVEPLLEQHFKSKNLSAESN